MSEAARVSANGGGVRAAADGLVDEVRGLLESGFKQRQIGVRLGISQTKVWEIKRDLEAAGRLPAPGSVATLGPAEADEHMAATRRSRSEILVEQAALRAATLRSTTRTLVDHVVGADEWVTDPAYPDAVRVVTADAVREAAAHIDHLARELGLRLPARKAGDPR